MSLIVCVYVPTGIVISGDSRTTATLTPIPLPGQAAVTSNITLSDATNKVFLLFGRFGVGTFGDAIVNNMPIAHYVEQFHASQQSPANTQACAQSLLAFFRTLNPAPNCGFVVAGYDGANPFVYGVDTRASAVQHVNILPGGGGVDYGIVRGGDTAIVDRLLSQPQFNPLFNLMNVQDAVDYSRHLIRATIDQMRFEPRFPTVGGAIDTLFLNPTDCRFLKVKAVTAT